MNNIRHKTLAVTGALMALAVVIALIGLNGIHSIQGKFDRLGQQAVPAQILLLNVDRDSYQAQLAYERALYASTAEARETAVADFEENVGQTVERFGLYQDVALREAGEESRWQTYNLANAQWAAAGRQLIDRTPVGGSVDLDALAAVQRLYDVARDEVDALGSDIYENVIPEATVDVDDTAQSQTVLLVIALVAGAFVLRVVMKGLRPLQGLAEAAERIAMGDTTVQITATGTDDEVGRLSASFEDVIAYVGEMSMSLEAVANGDLTANPRVRGEHDVLGRSIQALLASLRDVVGGLRSAVEHLGGSSGRLVRMSDQLGQSANDTSIQASTAAAAGQEMHASIREVAHNAAEAVNVSGRAVDLAGRASDMVARLEQSSGEIGAVLGVITTIAAQTNLLALNATIEAARAGDAGRGFAVVADEVKHLATQTTEATDGVRDRVAAIQADTAQAIQSINEVTEIIATISEHMHGIASAVEEQEATTNEIAITIEGVSNTADTTSSVTSQTGSAAGELDQLAQQLDQLISRFTY